MSAALIQIMAPVYNEGNAVLTFYENLKKEEVHFDELFFVYDFDQDTTLPFIAELQNRDKRVYALKNSIGRGVVNALKAGFLNAKDGVLIVCMADNSDKLSIIPEMIHIWKNGAVIVSPSRYMTGGKQHGGPFLKKTLSRLSGMLLALFGFPTSDPTNNFKLYDAQWLREQIVESTGGFEVALELTGKAFLQGRSIAQLPTEWWDRTQGKSNFKLWKWMPLYLKWYVPLLWLLFVRNFSTKKNTCA